MKPEVQGALNLASHYDKMAEDIRWRFMRRRWKRDQLRHKALNKRQKHLLRAERYEQHRESETP